MSDDFDLLETSSNEKTEKVDVNWGKAIDTMKSKLSQEDDPEVRQKILNATLDDVVHMAEKDRTTLLDAIKDLTDYQDEVGIIFEKFSSLNATEQKVIDDAQKALERARIELEDAKNKPDTWWNNLWGRKSKIKKEEVEFAVSNKDTYADSVSPSAYSMDKLTLPVVWPCENLYLNSPVSLTVASLSVIAAAWVIDMFGSSVCSTTISVGADATSSWESSLTR